MMLVVPTDTTVRGGLGAPDVGAWGEDGQVS